MMQSFYLIFGHFVTQVTCIRAKYVCLPPWYNFTHMNEVLKIVLNKSVSYNVERVKYKS